MVITDVFDIHSFGGMGGKNLTGIDLRIGKQSEENTFVNFATKV